MDHIVYLEAEAKELENLLEGKKTMIIRGAAGRKIPYGRVFVDDTLYLINNNAEGLIKAKATVSSVLCSEKLTPVESQSLINENQTRLQLTASQMKRWSGKRYLVLIELHDITKIEPFSIDKSHFGNMDDWLPVGNIETVKL